VGHSVAFEWATEVGLKVVGTQLSRHLITTEGVTLIVLTARFSLNCIQEYIRYFKRIMCVCLCALKHCRC